MSVEEPNLENYGAPTYPLKPDPQTTIRLSAILNEAAHVLERHAEGLWKTVYKDGFARLLVPNIGMHSKLIRSILKFDDRVFSIQDIQ
ncbi:hypothetical protein H8K35_00255 [Undibacterium sp. LX40W]|uniref:Uncharacterized protein n=1 Tax=Undibacterium nitidum TaxID=2762298 RepID=A0A923HK92_9BURK|nr:MULTISPECIES: hypothetical protein [Undibacterium]MBC3881185.1 hypothetical protein [Undibacterium nitidum]MBC3890082.1 hypothetical protein [Undibacterium sp. LX40W]